MSPALAPRRAAASARGVCSSLLTLLAVVAVARAPAARCELRPGATLSSENWEEAKGLLPEEFLEAYRRGDFKHQIASWEAPKLGEEPTFSAALKENEDRFDLDADGSIIDRRTGKPPTEIIMAWPFPKIDPSDPRAATKIVWNYFYTLYYGGNGPYPGHLLWISRH